MEQKIRDTAESLFFTYGLRSVSMDDIAREAGVSKKTIYRFFEDKNTLVLNVISKLVQEQKAQLKSSLSDSENAIHEVILIAENIRALILKLRPVLLFDLSKNFPECRAMMRAFKEDSLRQALHNNLAKGISEGLYRQDLNAGVITQFGLVQFSSFFAPENYPNSRFQTTDVIGSITKLYLHGISSSDGRLLTENYFENKQHEHTL